VAGLGDHFSSFFFFPKMLHMFFTQRNKLNATNWRLSIFLLLVCVVGGETEREKEEAAAARAALQV
jgi:hypothetical protein